METTRIMSIIEDTGRYIINTLEDISKCIDEIDRLLAEITEDHNN